MGPGSHNSISIPHPWLAAASLRPYPVGSAQGLLWGSKGTTWDFNSPAEDRDGPETKDIFALRTYVPKPNEIDRAWHLVDADGLVLGRMATEVARILRGKHQPYFARHADTGDHVVVVNAGKVIMTADKASSKLAYRHSGYPGGLKSRTYASILADKPEEVVLSAVRGMLPKNTLGRQQLAKLKVYSGPDHPHAAQNPQPLDFPAARRSQGPE